MNNGSKVSGTATRTITLEEHYATPAFIEGPGRHHKERPQSAQLIEQLCDLGDRRIADMDDAGIDVQVLSLVAPGVDQLDAAEASEMAYTPPVWTAGDPWWSRCNRLSRGKLCTKPDSTVNIGEGFYGDFGKSPGLTAYLPD